MSETGSDTRSGLGARLRAGRERMGLTQLQAAEKLHVDAKVVESLEAERYDVLGAPVFVRGHLKRYAELIGEQIAELLALYTGGTKPAAPDLTRLPKVTRSSKPSQLAVPALLVLIAFVMLGVVWWIVQSVNKPGKSDSASSAHEVSTDSGAITPGADGTGPDAASAGGTSIAQPGAVNVPNQSAQSANAARSGAANPAPAGAASAAANGAPGSTAPADQGAAAPARGKGMEVTLRFASDSWVEVYDAKGEKLFYDIGSADSQRTISGTPPFRVTFANAPGVSLDVNGKPATVPANAVHEEAADFIINRSGRIVRARPAAPPSEGK
jgi:cytoskeleton protein RodZ